MMFSDWLFTQSCYPIGPMDSMGYIATFSGQTKRKPAKHWFPPPEDPPSHEARPEDGNSIRQGFTPWKCWPPSGILMLLNQDECSRGIPGGRTNPTPAKPMNAEPKQAVNEWNHYEDQAGTADLMTRAANDGRLADAGRRAFEVSPPGRLAAARKTAEVPEKELQMALLCSWAPYKCHPGPIRYGTNL
jgi:hypothetical protein